MQIRGDIYFETHLYGHAYPAEHETGVTPQGMPENVTLSSAVVLSEVEGDGEKG